MSYDTTWETICERNGWDSYNDCPGDHSDELSDDENNALSSAWHAEYGEYEVDDTDDYDWQYGQPGFEERPWY